MLNEHVNNCRICGLDQSEPVWGFDGKSPTHHICACCGAEFGIEDFTLIGIKEFREQWLKTGARWWIEKQKPDGWNLEQQLENIAPEFR